MENKSKIGPLDISSNAVVTWEAWSKWKRSLSYFIESKSITDSKQQRAILLCKGGSALQDIYASLEQADPVKAAAAKDSYAFAINLLDNHFKPTVNRTYERYMFRSCKQNGESIEQFVIKLRRLSTDCQFKDVNEEIADQIVLGTSSQKLRKKVLQDKLTKLEEIVALGKLTESVSVQSTAMQGGESTVTNAAIDSIAAISSSVQRPFPQRGRACQSCGSRYHETNAKECRAREGLCFVCHKKGHFANRCPERPRRPRFERDEASASKPKSSVTKSSTSDKKDEVKFVRTRTEADVSDSDDSDFSFMIESSMKLPEDLCENRVPVVVGGVQTRMSVDSGSSRDTIDAITWKQLVTEGVQSKPADVTKKLFPYGRKRELDIERAVFVIFQAGENTAQSKTYVLAESEGRCEPIIGSKTAKALGILRVGIGTAGDQSGDRICQLKQAERPKLGKLKNFQLILPVDRSVNPVAQGCRRIPFALRRPIAQRLDELLEDDIIEKVSGATPWVSNLVPSVKKNGELRICVDMRRANSAVLRERYPIPVFDEIVADLRNCAYFSKIDLNSAYHQVELAEESREITTFVAPQGLFRFKRLFFGIRCAPEIFQRIMQDVLRDIPNVRVFFDDIIVFSDTKANHKIHVRQVMNRLTEAGLTINEEKSVFGKTKIEFLGHKISKNTVEPSDSNVESIRNFTEPKCKKDLQSFLGLLNFVSRFIPHFSTLTAPLRGLLRKNVVFRWGESQRTAFETLKNAVADMKMAIFDPEAKTILLTDASPVGLGAVLMQIKPEGKEPEIVAFASHSLTSAERNYSQIEREALGLVWGCEKFRMYLLGRHFELLTDHKPLEMLFGPKSKPNARLERWIMKLQCFDYSIRHISGEANIADPFSRLLQESVGEKSCSKSIQDAIHNVVAMAIPKKFHLETIRDESLKDEEIQAVISALKTAKPMPPEFVRIKYELADCDGILLRGDRIVPPKILRRSILEQAHESHPGMDVMKRRLRSKVWWPKMDSEVENFVRKCLSCIMVSAPDPPPPMTRTTLPSQGWEYVAIDHLGPLPSGDHIFVVVDYFSRFVEIAFTKSTSSADTIKQLWRIFSRHGFPARLKSDNAQAFKSEEFEDFLREYGVEHVTSPPLWPQANGEVERQNRSILKRLKIAASEGNNLEIEAFKYILLYNSTPHSTTGVAPAKLLFHRELRDKLPSISQPSVLRAEIADRDAAKKESGKTTAEIASGARASPIQKGDSVLLQAKPTSKLSPTFDRAPYTVIDRSANELTIQRGNQVLRRSVAAVKACPNTSSPESEVQSVDAVPPTAEPIPLPLESSTEATSASASPSPSMNREMANPKEPAAGIVTTRSGRIIRPPARFDE